jgi:hypothetical protein
VHRIPPDNYSLLSVLVSKPPDQCLVLIGYDSTLLPPNALVIENAKDANGASVFELVPFDVTSLRQECVKMWGMDAGVVQSLPDDALRELAILASGEPFLRRILCEELSNRVSAGFSAALAMKDIESARGVLSRLLSTLPLVLRAVLEAASVLTLDESDGIDLAVLADLTGRPLDAVRSDVSQLLRQGFLLNLAGKSDDVFLWSSPTVAKQTYSMMDRSVRDRFHLAAGEWFQEQSEGKKGNQNKIIEIRHFLAAMSGEGSEREIRTAALAYQLVKQNAIPIEDAVIVLVGARRMLSGLSSTVMRDSSLKVQSLLLALLWTDGGWSASALLQDEIMVELKFLLDDPLLDSHG